MPLGEPIDQTPTGLRVKKRYPAVSRSVRDVHRLPQQAVKREQRRKSVRRMVISGFTVAVLLAGAGVAYTWYNGQHQLAQASQPAPAYAPRPVFRPPKIASDAKIGAALQAVMTEVKPGENASINVRTNPEAACTIMVKYNEIIAKDSGLVPKVADEFGVVGWAWTVPIGTKPGAWPIDVTCKNKKYSAVVSSKLLVK